MALPYSFVDGRRLLSARYAVLFLILLPFLCRVCVQRLEKFISLLFGCLFLDVVSFLDFSYKLLSTSVDRLQIVVCKLSPPLLSFALVLLPFSLELIPVHGVPPIVVIAALVPARFGDFTLRSIEDNNRSREEIRRLTNQPLENAVDERASRYGILTLAHLRKRIRRQT